MANGGVPSRRMRWAGVVQKASRHVAALVVLGLLVGFGVLTPGTAHAAPGDPFSPYEPMIFIAQGTPQSTLYRAQADEISGAWTFTSEGTASLEYNGIGWNPHDGYIYGFRLDSNNNTTHVVRIGQGGVAQQVGIPIAHSWASWSGDFNPSNGQLYAFNSTGTQGAWYNVETGNSGTFTLTGPPTSDGSQLFDVVYADGYFWSLSSVGMTRINTATGQRQVFPLGFDVPAGSYGAAWRFGNGNLGFGRNGGEMLQIEVHNPTSTTPTFSLISSQPTPAHSRNDGTSIPGLETDLSIEKAGDAVFTAGEEFTYTITVTNNGPGVSSGWTMTDVIPNGLTLTDVQAPGHSYMDGNKLVVTGGRIGVDESRAVTLTVRADEALNGCVSNTASILGNEDDTNPANDSDTWEACHAPVLEVVKVSDASVDVGPGDTVRYSVTATNTGGGAYTADNPAVVLDDITELLDDADFDVASISADKPGNTGYLEPIISWEGALEPGETVTLTYEVTLKGGGDGELRNLAWAPEDPEDREPPTECLEDDPRCDEIVNLLPKLTVEKTTNADAFTGTGDTIEYTVTVTNPGPGDFSAANPATMTDDLTDVLASGELVGTPVASVGDVTISGNMLAWSGVLVAGESATITYEVQYTATYENEQDSTLENTACVPEEHVAPGAESCATVETPGPVLSQWKTVTSDDDPVVAGSVLTYTLFFENSGDAPLEIDAVDRLDFVLDDADVTVEPSSDTLTAVRDGQEISVTGTVPAGETYEVSYQVTMKADGERGDSVATNFLLDAGEEPPTDGVCVPTDEERPDCTTTPVFASMLLEKRGQGPAGELPLAGAEFSLLTPGGDTIQVTDESTQGVFLVEGLEPGVYTLTETKAPEGYTLLAEEITFEVLPSGAVATTETDTARVESDGEGTFRLIITDLEAFTLPLSGGAGSTPWILGGLLLAGVALVNPLVRARREQLAFTARA